MSENTLKNKLQIKKVSGRGIPVPGNDIDTDRIIPARFMKCVTFDELGQYAFYDSRFSPDGSKKPHPFNEEKYLGASVMVVNRNFGCGSSREHAPQSLMRHGIKAFVGESFAEIFADNCTSLGLPAVMAQRADVENLMKFIQDDPGSEVTIDLESKKVEYGDFSIDISQSEQSRGALIQGAWDSTMELLSASGRIHKVVENLPYMNGFRSEQR